MPTKSLMALVTAYPGLSSVLRIRAGFARWHVPLGRQIKVVLRLHLDLPRAVRAPASPARQAVLLYSYYSMCYSPSISAIAVLPTAPRNGSPVPWLTSLYHKAYAGPYGNRSYPGNCSGELIKDLLKYFRPQRVLDPMTGSGTWLMCAGN